MIEKYEKLLSTAYSRLETIVNQESYHFKQKFKNLPAWWSNASYYFKKEIDKKLPNKYYYFKRGSVVRVDFGVNMGSEFSNIHLAIVLNKKDSPKTRTLTVVPLTSKEGSGRLPLGKDIFIQTVVLIKEQLNEIKAELNNADKTNETELKSIAAKIDDLTKVFKVYSAYNKASYVRTSDVTTISKLRIIKLNKLDPAGKIRLTSTQMSLISKDITQKYLSE